MRWGLVDRQCQKLPGANARRICHSKKHENLKEYTPHVRDGYAYECACCDVEGDNRDACEKVLKIAKSLYFLTGRTSGYSMLREGMIDGDALKRFRRFIETERMDLKKEDAIEALKRIRDIREVTG